MIPEIDEGLKLQLEELAEDIKTEMQRQNLVVSGKTRDSLRIEVSNGKGELWGSKFIETLETGRGPARAGNNSNNQFLENLKEWILRKDLTFKSQKELERFAKFLKWHINKFGDKQFRSGQRRDVLTSPINKFIENFPKRMHQVITTEISKTLW